MDAQDRMGDLTLNGSVPDTANSAHLNREPSEIDRKRGEAAMMWLERILDRYDAETSVDDYDEEDDA